MADDVLQLNLATVPGGKVEDVESLVGAGGADVIRQRLQVTGATLIEIARVIAADPTGAEYALVTRNIPSGTQPVSAASLPLPTGAATEATLATRATEATLASVLAQLDVALSTRASEATVASILAQLVAQLDVALSTRASEATLGTRASEATLATRVADATITARLNTLGQKTMANSAPVVIASDQSAVPVSGSVTATNASIGVNTDPAPASSTQVGGPDASGDLQAAQVLPSAPAGTEHGLVTRNIPSGTQPVSAASLPLPTGAATEATLASVLAQLDVDLSTRASEVTLASVLAQLDVALSTRGSEATLATLLTTAAFQARINTLGQKAMAASTPVVVASDQSAVPVSAASLPLPTGAATEVTLASVLAQLDVALSTRASAANQTNGTQQTKITDGTDVALVSAAGALHVDGSAVTQPVSSTQLPAALVGGRLDENVGAWLGSTAPSVGQKTMANSLPVAIASDQTLTVTSAAPTSATATLTTQAASIANVTLLASNANRKGAMILNDGANKLYVKCGTTAATTDFSILLLANESWQVPFGYTGRIDGIWDVASGTARMTEFT